MQNPDTPITAAAPATHLVSLESLQEESNRQHKRLRQYTADPPRPGLVPVDDDDDDDDDDNGEVSALTNLYLQWTGKASAPWTRAAANDESKPPKKRRRFSERMGLCSEPATSKEKTLAVFDRDLETALETWAVSGGGVRSTALAFVGKTQTIRGKTETDPVLRLVAVLWSPSYLAAKHGSVSIRDTSEGVLTGLVESCMIRYATRRVEFSIAYVLPRWVAPSGVERPRDLFLGTRADLLAASLWQLGLRLCLLKPHAILSTSHAVARLIGCCNSKGFSLDETVLCTDEGKRLAALSKVIPCEPNYNNSEPSRLSAPVRRDLASGPLLVDEAALPIHLRCPHPYLLTRKVLTPDETRRQTTDKEWFIRTMKRLAEVNRTPPLAATNIQLPHLIKFVRTMDTAAPSGVDPDRVEPIDDDEA